MVKTGKRVAGDDMRMSDALWERVEPLLHTGCQWKSMP